MVSLILVFVLLLVAGGAYLGNRFVPAVHTAFTKLPVVGPLLTRVTPTTVDGPVDPLKAEKLQIQQETAKLATLQAELTKLQTDLNAKEADIIQREAAAQTLMDDAQALKTEYEGRTAALDQQVKLYAAMKPDKAAAVMNELSDAEVAAVLRKLDTALAAKIIAYLQPARAARIISLLGN
jgi:flagellar motility protein MotE (MotC chaperone)